MVYPDNNDQLQWQHNLLSGDVNIAILWEIDTVLTPTETVNLKFIQRCGDYIWISLIIYSSKKPNRVSQEFHEILILVKCKIIRHLMLSIIPYLHNKKIYHCNLHRLKGEGRLYHCLKGYFLYISDWLIYLNLLNMYVFTMSGKNWPVREKIAQRMSNYAKLHLP